MKKQHDNKKRNKVKTSFENKTYYAVVYTIIIFLIVIVLYPLVYIVSSSFSSPAAVSAGKVVLFPVELSLRGYEAVFQYKEVWIGYRNTVFYTIVGTVINVILSMFTGYALSVRGLPLKKTLTFLFTFTMIFSGGLIPTYLLLLKLNIVNTVFAMLIPGAINITNMILARTFIMSIPRELQEAAFIDGTSYAKYFFKIVIPLSKPIIAVLFLYYAIGHWNSYFNAMIYLSNRDLFPLQLFLRDILINNSLSANVVLDAKEAASMQGMQDLLKYSLIVVSTVPILCIYPFVQKYFNKGVMMGSLKG